MKKCSKCQKLKDEKDFHKDKKNPDGLNGNCKECRRKADAPRRTRVKELSAEQARQYYENRQRDAFLKSRYGISASEYDALLSEQGGVCAVCKNPPNGKRLHVDHDHKTNKVRGLLCTNCNFALGYAKDSESVLTKLLNYLTTRRG